MSFPSIEYETIEQYEIIFITHFGNYPIFFSFQLFSDFFYDMFRIFVLPQGFCHFFDNDFFFSLFSLLFCLLFSLFDHMFVSFVTPSVILFSQKFLSPKLLYRQLVHRYSVQLRKLCCFIFPAFNRQIEFVPLPFQQFIEPQSVFLFQFLSFSSEFCP